jgi:hypothetical protein
VVARVEVRGQAKLGVVGHRIASASVVKRNSGATGPKISSLATFMSRRTSASTVGS